MKVVVVGAGLGGLSAACHLSGQGHEVVVVERAAVSGGRAGVWQTEGYTLDTGPSVLTMTGLLSDVFTAAGSDMNEMLELMAVDPMYRATFPDGTAIRTRHGMEPMREEILRECGTKDAEQFDRFVTQLRAMYDLEMPNFIDRNFNSMLDMAWPVKPVARLLQLGGMRKLSAMVKDYFDDPRLQRLFSFQAMYAGLSPFDALAVYSVITYMDSVEGVYFPKGGMHAIPVALAAAAEKAGATFTYGVGVEHLLRNGRTVTGVKLDTGEKIKADAVVANPDLPFVYRDLLPDLEAPRKLRKGNYSPSCTTWLAGVRGNFPEDAAHHNIHFGGQWKEAFDALLNEGRPMPDPSILVTSHTQSDPGLAPSGGHTIFALEPMPNIDGNIDWATEREPLKARLLQRVADHGYPTAADVERFVDVVDWQNQDMEKGTPFALSHQFFQSGPFRPNNIDKRVDRLAFVGSGTVPGVGVPMVLLSGRLAAERVNAMASKKR